MFEENFVDSQVSHVSTTQRWTMLGSTALQLAIAATLVTLPLLHPERLSAHLDTPIVFTPPPPKPPLRVIAQQSSTPGSDIAAIPYVHPITTLIPRDPGPAVDAPPTLTAINMTPSIGSGLPSAILGTSNGSGTNVVPARPAPPKRVTVSSGVSEGLLLTPIRPSYPAIAKAAGVSGTVIVEAVISKTGAVESLHVISGHEILRNAALEAIRAAHYRPYLLNGEPTEVQTTFTVNFRISS